MRTPSVLAAAALIALAVSCSRTLDTKGLETQIRQVLAARGGSTVSVVRCPDGVRAQTGGSFTCTATGAGVTWTIRVTQRDDHGGVQMEIVNTDGGT